MAPANITGLTITLLSVGFLVLMQLTNAPSGSRFLSTFTLIIALGGPLVGMIIGFRAWRKQKDKFSVIALIISVLVLAFFSVTVFGVLSSPSA